MTVAELRERMSNDEFMYWAQYYALEAADLDLAQRKAKGEGRAGHG